MDDVRDVLAGTLLPMIPEWISAHDAADDLLDALTEVGYVVVPREPTEAMLTAAMPSQSVLPWQGPIARTDYLAMIDAA